MLYRSANSMFSGRITEVHRDALILVDDPAAPPWAVAMGICCAALIDSYAGDPDPYRKPAEELVRRTGVRLRLALPARKMGA